MIPFWTVALLLACFLLGSIPTGPILARRLKGVDLRRVGSGNIGATNAFRVLGPLGGAAVLLGDALKGYAAVQLAPLALVPGFLLPLFKVAFGLTAVAGHNWSPFMGFRGGKGIATSFGVLLALAPKAAGMAALLWLALVLITRYSSVGSLGAALALPLLMFLYGDHPVYLAFGALAALLAVVRHRENLRRLLAGQEMKLGEKTDLE